MLRLVLILLHYVTLTSTRSVVNFYSASEHAAVINDNRPAGARFSPTPAPAAAEDTSLNVPHPIAADTVTSFGHNTQPNAMTGILDSIGNNVNSRKLPLLRVEIDTIKSPDPPPPADYAPHNTEIAPQHEVLTGAEVPSVNLDHEKASEPDVVFSNGLTRVEVIPSDAVSIIIPSSPIAPTSGLADTKKEFLKEAVTQKHIGKESESDVSLVESGHVVELVEHGADDLPSPKTLLLKDDRKPKIISSISIIELSNGSAFVEDIGKEPPLSGLVHEKFEAKSIEDEDNDAFNELDEKSEVDLEFHDDADLGTKAAAEESLSTSSTTPATTASSTKVEEPMADEEIFDLLMYLVMLLPHVEKSESVWSKIIAGLQCALRDCRRAFPHLTTSATPIGNGTFIIRRARSECSCPVGSSKDRLVFPTNAWFGNVFPLDSYEIQIP